MITLNLDYNLFLQIILVFWIIRGTFGIINGLIHDKKPEYYGGYDIADGILALIIVLIVVIY